MIEKKNEVAAVLMPLRIPTVGQSHTREVAPLPSPALVSPSGLQ